jgi:iron complex outermembrane receptor protein
MNILQRAAFAALLILPAMSQGQESGGDDDSIEEIVVVGRSVVTSSTQIEVQRELLVDSATVLKDIPGANVNSNGQITGIAQYRGMYGDRISVDIDDLGTVSGGPNAMDTPLSYLSPMITEELVVERGIASVSKAPESIGGHISTRLARGSFSEDGSGVSGVFGTRYSSNGGVSTSAGRLTLADDVHRVSILAERDKGDDISTPVGDILPSRLSRERYDLSYAFDNGENNLLLFAGGLDTEDSGTPALPMDIRFIETELYGLQFGSRLTDSLRIDGRVAYNDVEHLMDNFTLSDAPASMRFRQNLARGSGSKFHLSGLFELDDSELRVGVDGGLAEHDSVITNPNMVMFRVDNFVDVERDVAGMFLEWNRDLGLTAIEVGLRYKQVEANAGTVGAMGMLGPMGINVDMLADAFNSADRDLSFNTIDAVFKYRHELSARTEWVFEVGSKTRAPSYQELYLWLPLQATGGLADGRTYIGDLNLKEERSNEIVVGVTSEVGRFMLSPQVFYRKVDDYIQGIPSTNMRANMVSMMMSGAPALQFSNVDAEIWGADLAWKLELSDRLYLDGIATYIRGKRTDISDNLYRLAPFNGSVGLTYEADSWSVKPEIVFYSEQDKVSAYNGEQASSGYELVNVAFAWDATEFLRIEARVDNLFDETYQDHLVGINRAMQSDIPVGERLYGAERTIRAGVNLSF